MTIRELLQVLGTDIFRNMIYDKVWAEAPFRKNYGDADAVIITDLRFPNEKFCTEERGGVIIHLERKTNYNDTHESETALNGYVFENTYHNDGTLENLEEYIAGILRKQNIL